MKPPIRTPETLFMCVYIYGYVYIYPRGSIYSTIMELGPERPSILWLWGPNSIMVVYMEPLGYIHIPYNAKGVDNDHHQYPPTWNLGNREQQPAYWDFKCFKSWAFGSLTPSYYRILSAYAYMVVCMWVLYARMHGCAGAPLHTVSLPVCQHACMHACMYVCIYACMHIRKRVRVGATPPYVYFVCAYLVYMCEAWGGIDG